MRAATRVVLKERRRRGAGDACHGLCRRQPCLFSCDEELAEPKKAVSLELLLDIGEVSFTEKEEEAVEAWGSTGVSASSARFFHSATPSRALRESRTDKGRRRAVLHLDGFSLEERLELCETIHGALEGRPSPVVP